MKGRWTMMAGLVGLLGLAVSVVAVLVDAERAAQGWIIAWGYWASLAVGALLLLAITHAMRASWFVVLRRYAESLAGTLVLLAVLFVPIFFALDTLYPWAGDIHQYPEHVQHILHHRAPYLNGPFFIGRSIVYLAVWVVIAELLISWSRKQDRVSGVVLPERMRRLGSAGIPLVALTLTWATFDWFMSLEPVWFSTIYGILWFGGGFLGATSLVVVLMYLSERSGTAAGAQLSPAHYHNMGKLMFTFTVFWAYAAFSQLIITYMGDLPEEVVWYLPRFEGGWWVAFVVLAVAHFGIPFLVLMPRGVKRNPPLLAGIAIWQLALHALDGWWVLMPSMNPDPVGFPWPALAAWAAIGGLSVAFAGWRLRDVSLVPEGDPLLPASLAYKSV